MLPPSVRLLEVSLPHVWAGTTQIRVLIGDSRHVGMKWVDGLLHRFPFGRRMRLNR